jgi:putative ATPase
MTPAVPPAQPLAQRLRPSELSQVVGQSHLLGPGKPLHMAFASGQPHAMIFWGPPGVGKTTLARLTAQAFGCRWLALSAVLGGVKDIRAAVEQAEVWQAQGQRTILFVDEIHRFNKAQQDALLPYTETGLVTLIGATTENPSFEVNAALLSRVQVYVLQLLSPSELHQLLARARAQATPELTLAPEAEQLLVQMADGDARRLLNLLEQCAAAAQAQGLQHMGPQQAQQALTAHAPRFDKGGDQFYDQISALHKSVRGSDPDAALYWLCRMLEGGTDPRYLARRLLRMAWEDIGLADPRAMQLANDAAQTYERLGSPEGELALAQTVLYLAVAAKSNAGYTAYNQARAAVKHGPSLPVPMHLRNAPTQLMKNLGHGQGYRYDHDEPNGHASGQRYLPVGMDDPHWYRPTDRGLEARIAEKLATFKRSIK